jgi:hypothetical protein
MGVYIIVLHIYLTHIMVTRIVIYRHNIDTPKVY